ncbi:hypothetical protein QFZ49_001110 [Streptomyces turgidiscabies]|uniref:Uncharacterized protein n=1 Tax=Streptomyces turgidiscabies TaxID=85558 RepID=A0ABU0RHK4_9ACTN|nr:hypothetical protein [Streptomyces turgidiscabies]
MRSLWATRATGVILAATALIPLGAQAAQAAQATAHERPGARSATAHGASPSVRVIDYVAVV